MKVKVLVAIIICLGIAIILMALPKILIPALIISIIIIKTLSIIKKKKK